MLDQLQEQLPNNHDLYVVPGLQRGLMVLEEIAHSGQSLSITEIGKRLGLGRSAIFRLVYTLRHMGFLESVEGTKLFMLGPRVLSIGFAFLASRDIIEVARPELELLRDRTGVSSHLAIRDLRDVLFLCCVQTRSGFQSNLNVGTRVPAYAAPMGWLLLSDLAPRDLAALFANVPFTPLTEHTPANVTELIHRIGAAVAEKRVFSRGIMEVGGSSVSAPIFDKAGQVTAAIDISGPDSAFDLDRMAELYAPEVTMAAERISARLGYRSGPQ